MSTTKLNYTDLILSNFPVEVKVSHVQSWIGQDDQESRRSIIDFIFHRIHHRYIVPLFHVPKEYKSGFLMMASGCLMIETMQSFYTGVMDTKCKSRETFEEFFKREKKLFPELAVNSDNFYYHVRCGILHQGETREGYRIVREGPLFIPKEKTINANKFLQALECSLWSYVHNLHTPGSNLIWDNAVEKLTCICANCQTTKEARQALPHKPKKPENQIAEPRKRKT